MAGLGCDGTGQARRNNAHDGRCCCSRWSPGWSACPLPRCRSTGCSAQATGFGGTTQRAAAAPERDRRRARHGALRCRDRARSRLGVPPAEARDRGPSRRARPRYFSAPSTADRAPVTGTGRLQRDADQEPASISTSCSASASASRRLAPGESRDMGVSFFVDPEMLTDPSTREVRTITLSYTMFRAPEAARARRAAAAPRLHGAFRKLTDPGLHSHERSPRPAEASLSLGRSEPVADRSARSPPGCWPPAASSTCTATAGLLDHRFHRGAGDAWPCGGAT